VKDLQLVLTIKLLHLSCFFYYTGSGTNPEKAGVATKSLKWILSRRDKLKTKVSCRQDMVYAILVLIFYAKIPNNPTYSFLLLLFFFQYIIQLIINNFTKQHTVVE